MRPQITRKTHRKKKILQKETKRTKDNGSWFSPLSSVQFRALSRHRDRLRRDEIERWIFDGAQVHFTAFPGLDADVIQHAEAITERPAVERIVRWPERNGIHFGFLGHFNGFLNHPMAIIPIEQKIFPFEQRLFQTARIAIVDNRFQVLVGLLKAA